MEKPTSPSSTENTTSATATSSSTVGNQSYPNPPSSPPHNRHQHYNQDMATDSLSSIYNSIFQPNSPLPLSLSLTPSSSSSSDDQPHLNLKLTSDIIATEHRLNQARFILEYQQLCDHYDLCFTRLQALMRELETLTRENADLRLANAELIELLSLSTATTSVAAVNTNVQREEASDWNMKRWETARNVGSYNAQRDSLPKSVSVRSRSYVKVKQQQQVSSNVNKQRHVVNPSLRVYVPCEARREDKAMELEVYNQGMAKTELCNKWQETGTCPYGDHCQFAHGITELRPVVRHPRYKTQVCRMVLAGHSCPYGHRCHFRHSLSEQERQLLLPR